MDRTPCVGTVVVGGKVGKLGGSFLGNWGILREFWQFEGNLSCFFHGNIKGIVKNVTSFPRNKSFVQPSTVVMT